MESLFFVLGRAEGERIDDVVWSDLMVTPNGIAILIGSTAERSAGCVVSAHNLSPSFRFALRRHAGCLNVHIIHQNVSGFDQQGIVFFRFFIVFLFSLSGVIGFFIVNAG